MGLNKRYISIEKVIHAYNDGFSSLEELFNADVILLTGCCFNEIEEIRKLVKQKNHNKIKEFINNLSFDK